MEINSVSDQKKDVLHIDYSNIFNFLKDEPPYIWLDYAEVIPGKYAKSYKLFTHNEWFFKIHYPNNPLVPGVFLLESLMQTAALTIHTLNEPEVDFVYSNKVFSAEFPNAVRPGDTLETEIEIKSNRHGIVKASGIAFISRNSKKATACKAEFQLLIPGLLKKFSPTTDKQTK